MIEDVKVDWDEIRVVCDRCGDDIYLLSDDKDILCKDAIEYYIGWTTSHKCKSGFTISTSRFREDNSGNDITLTPDEYDHIVRKRGNCGCDICFKFKTILDNKIKEIEK